MYIVYVLYVCLLCVLAVCLYVGMDGDTEKIRKAEYLSWCVTLRI